MNILGIKTFIINLFLIITINIDKINQYEADDKLATYYIKAITTIKDHCSSQTIKGINGVLNLFKNWLSQLRDKNTDKNLFNDEKMEEINVIVLYHVLKNKLME